MSNKKLQTEKLFSVQEMKELVSKMKVLEVMSDDHTYFESNNKNKKRLQPKKNNIS